MIPAHLVGRSDLVWRHRVIDVDGTELAFFECPIPTLADLETIVATIESVVTGGREVEAHEYREHRNPRRVLELLGVTLTWQVRRTTQPDADGVIEGVVINR